MTEKKKTAFGFFTKTIDDNFKKRVIVGAIMGFFFSLFIVFGCFLQYKGYTLPGFKGKAKMALIALAIDLIMWIVFYYLLYAVEKIDVKKFCTGEFKGKKVFFLSWLTTFVLWIPAFLAYYPCVMSYDFHQQVGWVARGRLAYGAHHPFLSTLEIEFFYKLGQRLNNIQLGMSFMGIFHMVLISLAMAAIVYTISKIIRKKWVPIATTLVLALYPYNPVLTLCTTKDVVFMFFFIWFIALSVDLLLYEKTKSRVIVNSVFMLISGIMMSLFRNNAIYALMAAAVFALIFVKLRHKLYVLVMAALLFIGFTFGRSALFKAMQKDIPNGSVEMWSTVIVSYGRVETRHRDNMTPEVEAIIEKYLPRYSWDEYYPGIADALKSAVSSDSFEYNWAGKTKQVLKDYLYVFRQYPNECIDAILDLTRGYWFVGDNSFADVLGEGMDTRMGIIYTYNVSAQEGLVEDIPHESKLPFVEKIYEYMVSEDVCIHWPIVGILFRPAIYMWGLLILAVLFIYQKNLKPLSVTALAVMYLGTMLLGPVCQMRYCIPIMLAFVLLIPLLFTKPE